jgi:peptidoglycan/LPS O-acetylase OafA/YrhL
MSITSFWPSLLCMAIILGIAATPLFKMADSPPNPYAEGPHAERVTSLDGLRGFLAFGVFFHHAVITYFYLANGRWDTPPSRFYTLAGHIGVDMFFMITGYLFWSRLIRA